MSEHGLLNFTARATVKKGKHVFFMHPGKKGNVPRIGIPIMTGWAAR
jgi:hypothetical protein